MNDLLIFITLNGLLLGLIILQSVLLWKSIKKRILMKSQILLYEDTIRNQQTIMKNACSILEDMKQVLENANISNSKYDDDSFNLDFLKKYN